MGESTIKELLRRRRRRIERVRVEWPALYATAPETPSLRCHVLDISIDGARLALVDDPGEPLDHVCVELRPPDIEASLVLRAEVRNEAMNGGPRLIGIEFFNSTPRARLVLAELIARYG
jgi:hypothetical protein